MSGVALMAVVRAIDHAAFPAICIGVGLFLRALVAVLFPVEPISDFGWYLARAAELAAGKGYQEGGYPTAYWPVGWPAILSLGLRASIPAPVFVTLLNLAAAAATMALILWFGRHILNNERTARIALLGYAVYLNHVAYVPVAATELVYTAVAAGAFAAFLWRGLPARAAVLSGLLFGVAILIKPQTLLFPAGAAIAIALVGRERRWATVFRHGLLTYVCALLVVLPWSARNVKVFNEFVLVSSNGGVALLMGANDEMSGGHFELERSKVWQRIGIPFSERVSRQMELSRLQKAAAVQWIRDHPLEYLAWMPRKVFLLWHKDTDGFWSHSATYPGADRIIFALQLANQAFYMLVLALALPTAFLALLSLIGRSSIPREVALIFCMPAFVTILAAVFTGQIRYHFPAMPFMLLAAAWFLAMSIDRLKPR